MNMLSLPENRAILFERGHARVNHIPGTLDNTFTSPSFFQSARDYSCLRKHWCMFCATDRVVCTLCEPAIHSEKHFL